MGGVTLVKIDLVQLRESGPPTAGCHAGGTARPAGLWLRGIGRVHGLATPGAEPQKTLQAAARRQWKQDRPALDARRLIFVDETWDKTNMTRARGRAPVGQRLIAKVPHGHWKTTTLIAALGMVGSRGRALIDRELYLPKVWCDDPQRLREARVLQ